MKSVYLNVIKNLIEFEDVKDIRISKVGDGKVEIWDGDKYVGRYLLNHESKLVFRDEDRTFYYNGTPCEKLDKDFVIPTDNQIDTVNDYPAGTYYVFATGEDTYITGKTISGDLKLKVLQPFYA